MPSSTKFVVSLIFITVAHGLAPPSPDPAIYASSSLSTSSALRLVNLSSTHNDVDLINATEFVKCDGKYFGYHLNPTSCEEVWREMPTDSQILHWGARSQGFFERPLPYRYLSGKFSAIHFRYQGIYCLLISGLRWRSVCYHYRYNVDIYSRQCHQPRDLGGCQIGPGWVRV